MISHVFCLGRHSLKSLTFKLHHTKWPSHTDLHTHAKCIQEQKRLQSKINWILCWSIRTTAALCEPSWHSISIATYQLVGNQLGRSRNLTSILFCVHVHRIPSEKVTRWSWIQPFINSAQKMELISESSYRHFCNTSGRNRCCHVCRETVKIKFYRLAVYEKEGTSIGIWAWLIVTNTVQPFWLSTHHGKEVTS